MNKSEFKKAIADSEAPTPGYLYRDIASWTYVNYATQLQVIKALFDKLQPKNGPFVLYKCLHLIKVLCETGQEGFQKELQLGKYTNTLKDFASFRGPLDAKYGDSWNERVRREAEAALVAVFHTRVIPSESPAVVGGGGGFGSGSDNFSGASISAARATGGDWRGMGGDAVALQGRGGPRGSGSAGATYGGDEPVMPSFAFANPYSGASGSIGDNGTLAGRGIEPFSSAATTTTTLQHAVMDAPSLHIGEMPSESRRVQQQQEKMTGLSASSSPHSLGGKAQHSKTFLQQLASTAKSGVNLMTQFEILKGKQEQLYGDQFGQAGRAAAFSGAVAGRMGRGCVDEVGSYQPVGLAVAPPTVYTSETPAYESSLHSSALSTPHPITAEANAASYAPTFRAPTETAMRSELVSTFADPASVQSMMPPSPSQRDADRCNKDKNTLGSSVSEPIHAYARAKQTPSRVELSQLLRAIEEAVATPADANQENDACIRAHEVAEAIRGHLGLDKPWQERLNAMTCLEAILRGGALPLRDAVAQAFTQHPNVVHHNCHVVQASLRDKAVKVAQLLKVSAAASPPPQPVAMVAANAHETSAAPRAATAATASASSQAPSPPIAFDDLFGKAPSPSPPASFSASPNNHSGADVQPSFRGNTFEGMTIRASASSRNGESQHRRHNVASSNENASPSFSSDAQEMSAGFGGGPSTGRPQRRPQGVTVPDEHGSLFEGVPATAAAPRKSPIQVTMRSTVALPPQQQQRSSAQDQPVASDSASKSDLDGLLRITTKNTPSTAGQPATAAATIGSTLDDLFAGEGRYHAKASAAVGGHNGNHHTAAFTTDDLFTVPTPVAAASAAINVPAYDAPLARIQALMTHLEHRYDPAAMAELERLIMDRQRALEHLSASGGDGAVARAIPVAAVPSTLRDLNSHRQFQTGKEVTAAVSERQQAKLAFADVQAEMKRQMEL